MTTIADLNGHHIGRRVSLTMQDGGVTHVGELRAIYQYATTASVSIRYDSGAEWKPGFRDNVTGATRIVLLDPPECEHQWIDETSITATDRELVCKVCGTRETEPEAHAHDWDTGPRDFHGPARCKVCGITFTFPTTRSTAESVANDTSGPPFWNPITGRRIMTCPPAVCAHTFRQATVNGDLCAQCGADLTEGGR